ncbi:MAG TPA: cytidine deaminase [Firmicutes bacterium]|nr:cytidine deaminase [Bacillota bacterium]
MSGRELLEEAIKARERAYVPYSDFKVGAAVLTKGGKVFTGCNIENAAFGPTICAERTAIFKAVSEGYREFRALAVVTATPNPASPCGVCRQVIAEFFQADTPIYLGNLQGDLVKSNIEKLLPGAFGARDLAQKGEV